MGSLLKSVAILLILFGIFSSCEQPEDQFIGSWRFDNYEVKEEGIGSIAKFIPTDWKNKVKSWINDGEGLANSTITFYPDGTYEEEVSHNQDKITIVKGQYAVMKDLSQINLKTTDDESVLPIVNLTDTSFTYKKEFGKFDVPLTVEIRYKRVYK